jgi:hypothetical protein
VSRRRGKFVKFNAAALAILVSGLLGSAAASAKDRKPKGSDNQAQVVGHISFAGLSAVDMAMQKKENDKYYLHVQHSKGEGISIIDISKPTLPKAVAVIPWSDPAVSGGPNFGGIARLDTNGELDATFGGGGTLTVDNNVTALLIDKNGDILAIEGAGNDGVVVAAYLSK